MPELKTAILARLRSWRNPPTCPYRPATITNLFGLRSAVHQQDSIGWYNFCMGRLGTNWQAVQQRYYEWLTRRNTGKAWVKALIQKVWAVSWDMWDHRNEVRLGTVSPALQREITTTNNSITAEFETGLTGLGFRDHHWLDKPIATVLKYDHEHKKQWLASIELARARHANRHEFKSSAFRRQRDFFISWTRSTIGPAETLPE